METTLAPSTETLQQVVKTNDKLPKDSLLRQQVKALLLDHLVLIGRQFEIPKDSAERSAYIGRWHHTICENNSSWPHGFDNVAIYKDFLSAVRDGRIKLQALSAFAHAMAFKDWVRAGNLSRFKPAAQKALPMPEEPPKTLKQQIKDLTDTINFCETNGFQLLPESHSRRQTYEKALKELQHLYNQKHQQRHAS